MRLSAVFGHMVSVVQCEAAFPSLMPTLKARKVGEPNPSTPCHETLGLIDLICCELQGGISQLNSSAVLISTAANLTTRRPADVLLYIAGRICLLFLFNLLTELQDLTLVPKALSL